MRRLIIALISLAAVASLGFALEGCSKKLTGMLKDSGAPHTVLFVQGPVDTVNHVAHLYWYGTEAHGYITGYEVRLVNPPPDSLASDTSWSKRAAADSLWHYTTRTDSVITVWTANGFTAPTFYVRAIDSRGVRDPNPAKETFQFKNNAPVVTLLTEPNRNDRSDTTFAAVTITWSISDPDGNPGAVMTHVWLDSMPGPPLVATGTTFTVPSESFKIGGVYPNHKRTLYIQGIDDGGRAGNIDSVTWFVRRPSPPGVRARLLLIDEQGLSDGGKALNDSVYIRAARDSLHIGTAEMAYLWIARNNPFKSSDDVYETMKLFDGVVWFRGLQTGNPQPYVSNLLLNYEDGIGKYLDNGGRIYLENQSLVQGLSSQGSLDMPWVSKYLQCDGVFQYEQLPDSSAQYNLNVGYKLYYGNPTLVDSLRSSQIVSSLRGFVVRNTSQIWAWAPPNQLSPANAFPMPVGVVARQPSGGAILANTFPPIIGGGLLPAVKAMANAYRLIGIGQ